MNLLPDALIIGRYRSFEREAVLPLRPLTLLYGRNNAGKSALLRALAILGESVATSSSNALIMPAGKEVPFETLAWQGVPYDYSFQFGLRWRDGHLREARYTIDGGPGRPSYIKELRLLGEGGAEMWAGISRPAHPMKPDAGHQGPPVQFVGLIPQSSTLSSLKELAKRMGALKGQVVWLDGVRSRPARTIQRSGEMPNRLSADGSNAPEFLLESPDLLSAVKTFYAALRPGRSLECRPVSMTGKDFQLTLNPLDQVGWSIELVDTGEGMAQVLPVLVAANRAALADLPQILAVEEPESHLHPDAQTTLARHLCELAARENPSTFIVETHSRVFLLGIQLAIAEKRLTPDKVSLAWIDQDETGASTITPVNLESTGQLGAGWPVTALSEDLRLATELSRLTLSHRS